jgi:hypothetical protein
MIGAAQVRRLHCLSYIYLLFSMPVRPNLFTACLQRILAVGFVGENSLVDEVTGAWRVIFLDRRGWLTAFAWRSGFETVHIAISFVAARANVFEKSRSRQRPIHIKGQFTSKARASISISLSANGFV